jgi:DNA-binding XRE family transcriptional regulator
MAKETKSYAQEAVRVRTGRDVEELLRELYIEQRRSQQEIADALGVARTTVTAWLGEFQISREDRDPLPPLVQA